MILRKVIFNLTGFISVRHDSCYYGSKYFCAAVKRDSKEGDNIVQFVFKEMLIL